MARPKKNRLIKFRGRYGRWVSGDVAQFDYQRAEEIVATGVASWSDDAIARAAKEVSENAAA